METETKTDVLLVRHPSGVFALGHRGSSDFLLLSPTELAAVVQVAYDEHGMLAAPSYAAEAERAPVAERCEACANHDPRDRRDHGHIDRLLQATHNVGVRA